MTAFVGVAAAITDVATAVKEPLVALLQKKGEELSLELAIERNAELQEKRSRFRSLDLEVRTSEAEDFLERKKLTLPLEKKADELKRVIRGLEERRDGLLKVCKGLEERKAAATRDPKDVKPAPKEPEKNKQQHEKRKEEAQKKREAPLMSKPLACLAEVKVETAVPSHPEPVVAAAVNKPTKELTAEEQAVLEKATAPAIQTQAVAVT